VPRDSAAWTAYRNSSRPGAQGASARRASSCCASPLRGCGRPPRGDAPPPRPPAILADYTRRQRADGGPSAAQRPPRSGDWSRGSHGRPAPGLPGWRLARQHSRARGKEPGIACGREPLALLAARRDQVEQDAAPVPVRVGANQAAALADRGQERWPGPCAPQLVDEGAKGDQVVVLLFCSSRAASPSYPVGAMRQQSPVGMPHPTHTSASEWPSGSAVFVCTPTGGRMEAGRVVLDGEQWRVWLRRGNGYRDRGTAPQRSAAVMALLDAATRPVRGARLAASMRLKSLPSVSQAGRPRRSGTRG
jgi:hypothetical protein